MVNWTSPSITNGVLTHYYITAEPIPSGPVSTATVAADDDLVVEIDNLGEEYSLLSPRK